MYSHRVSSFRLLVLLVAAVRSAAQATVQVDTSQTYQTIDGFGFSEAFGFGQFVQSAPAAQQTQALNYMFSTTEGAGFTILRNRIASDPGNTIEPNSPGSPSAAPTYTFDGNDQGQVWWTQKAIEYGVEYIYADAWSAPGYMKTNDNYEQGGYLCGVTGAACASGDWRQAYANYLVKYIQDYRSAGLRVDFVGFLNEPTYYGDYDSMLSNGTQAASFIPYLYDALESAGLSNSTGVTCCDAEGWPYQVEYTANIISAGVQKYVSRYTSHWYTGQGTSPIDTTVRVWQTEYADLGDAFSTAWYSTGAMNEGLTWANYLWQGLVEANLSAFLFWIGVQESGNSACLVSANSSAATMTPSGTLWAFAMYSRYIRPNAVRVETTGAPTDTRAAAFKNTDGSVVVVMLNNGTAPQSVAFAVSGADAASNVVGYIMDGSVAEPSSLPVTRNDTLVEASLSARSLVTIVMSSS